MGKYIYSVTKMPLNCDTVCRDGARVNHQQRFKAGSRQQNFIFVITPAYILNIQAVKNAYTESTYLPFSK